MEWISVDEKLPVQGEYVIVAKFDGRPQVKMYFVLVAERVNDRWYDGKDGSDVTANGKYGKVTHWMYLPDAPKGD